MAKLRSAERPRRRGRGSSHSSQASLERVKRAMHSLRARSVPFLNGGSESESLGLASSISYSGPLQPLSATGRSEYQSLMLELTQSLSSKLTQLTCVVDSSFQPDPSVLVIRWRCCWRSDFGTLVAEQLSNALAAPDSSQLANDVTVVAHDDSVDSAIQSERAEFADTDTSERDAAFVSPEAAQQMIQQLQCARNELALGSSWNREETVTSAIGRLDSVLSELSDPSVLAQPSHTSAAPAAAAASSSSASVERNLSSRDSVESSRSSGMAPSPDEESENVRGKWQSVSLSSIFKLDRDANLMSHEDVLHMPETPDEYERERQAVWSFLVALKPRSVNFPRWVFTLYKHDLQHSMKTIMQEGDDDVETEAGMREMLEDENAFNLLALANALLSIGSIALPLILIVLFIRLQLYDDVLSGFLGPLFSNGSSTSLLGTSLPTPSTSGSVAGA